ncbi:MAG: cyclic nucleotide-binding domain-containing protein, partial [Rhodospirillales bacterium]|nr:cyclic nucleotide-binding domain-containing protein [Rhodospirillales bacterium]
MPPFEYGSEREKGEVFGQPCSQCELAELSFCAGLSAADILKLTAILGHVQLPAHNTVFREGDPALYLYSITAGTVKLYKLLSDGRRQITAFLFPGDFFGLAIDGGYAYTAESLTPVALCRFPRRKLEQVLEEVPRLEKRLLSLAIDELAAAHEQMLMLGRKTAREKVASFLMMLSRRAAQRNLSPTTLALPMSRSDIADYLGLTIETVSRTLTQLKREEVIALPDSTHVVLRFSDDLKRLA